MLRRHRSHSADFKRQIVAEYHAGETLHAVSRRHNLSRKRSRNICMMSVLTVGRTRAKAASPPGRAAPKR
jgi:hypothetical protein